MNTVNLTTGEVAALRYAQECGRRLPAWIAVDGNQYTRPEQLDAEQFAEYAEILRFYNVHKQTVDIEKIRKWVVTLGILAIVSIVLAILF